jgi:hypothetical protein
VTLFLDTETLPFGPARMAPPLVCLQVGDERGAEIIPARDAESMVRALLEGDDLLVGVNPAYDMAVLAEAYPELRPLVFEKYERLEVLDLAIRQQLVDLAAGSLGWGIVDGKNTKLRYSMAELAKRHLDLDLAKGEETWRLRYGELMDVPVAQWPAEAREYAELDVIVPAHILPLVPAMPDEGRQTRSAFWIHLMSAWGMTTSPEAVDAFAASARTNYDRLSAELVALGFKRPDKQKRDGSWEAGSRDTKVVMARIVAAYAAKGVPHATTPTGKACIDDAACIASGDPALVTYGEFGSASKTLSNDVPLLTMRPAKKGAPRVPRKPLEPIHARFHVLLETGDIGCSAPNLVNLPSEVGVRECFVPRPGFVYLACDYAGIQLRTWAQVCINILGYSTMAEALNAGECPHTMIAAEILGEPYAAVKARPKKEIYYHRQCGKVGNFGRQGGMGKKRLVHAALNQYGVSITETQAHGIIRAWERRWREGRPYLNWASQKTANGKTRIEQYYSGRVRGGLGFCDLANGVFSALSYDALKDAGWLVAKACYVEPDSVLFGSRIVNAIHDELLLEVPEEIGHECALEVARLMELGAEKWIPDVPAVVESTLMRRWSKKAEPTYENGRLVPWG